MRVRASDPDLARILDAWPALPPPIRRVMLALVASTRPADFERDATGRGW
jgi:hypothetical protein